MTDKNTSPLEAEAQPNVVAARPPLPPFTLDTAMQKVRQAEDGWNTRNPEKVALAYRVDSRWRNRSEFVNGRQEIGQGARLDSLAKGFIIRVPKESSTESLRKIVRTQLDAEQVVALMSLVPEPISTLVLFLYATGKRGEEAVGIQPGDLDSDNILHIRRVVYGGRITELEQEELVPLDGPEHRELVLRMRNLGEGYQWVFHNQRADTPLNVGNARRRYLHPACAKIGIKVGGRHDFRHSLQSKLRRSGVDPVVRAGVMGHAKVELGPEVYDKASLDEKRAALAPVGSELLAKLLANASVQ